MINFNTIFEWIGKLIVLALAYFSPVKSIFLAIIFLIFIDLITGIYAAVKYREHFQARKLRYTVEKFVFYGLAIIVAYVFQREFAFDLNITQIVGGYIALTEIKSIYENIYRVIKIDIIQKIYEMIRDKFHHRYVSDESNNDHTDDYSKTHVKPNPHEKYAD